MRTLDEFLENITESDLLFANYFTELTQRCIDEMQRQNISYKELAIKMGLSESKVIKLLNMPQNLDIKTLARLSASLNFDVLQLKK